MALLTFLLALGTHFLAAAYMFFGACAISDTADRGPAPASPQGLICDGEDHWLNVVPLVALPASVLLAVALAVAWWPAPRWRWVGLTAFLWLPLVTAVALSLPSDTCSPEQRRDLRDYACDTTGNS